VPFQGTGKNDLGGFIPVADDLLSLNKLASQPQKQLSSVPIIFTNLFILLLAITPQVPFGIDNQPSFLAQSFIKKRVDRTDWSTEISAFDYQINRRYPALHLLESSSMMP
jgi:hypothetical protein